jgi:hypothetical protein
MPAGPSALLNRLPNGQTCPVCRERLLDTLRAPFPSERFVVATVDRAQELDEVAAETEARERPQPWTPRGLGA